MVSLLEAERLHYTHSRQFAMTDLSVSLREGEIVSIIGPNGSGKSTLLKLLARLLRPGAGAVRLCGRDIAAMSGRETARLLAMLSQTNDAALDISVRELVRFGRHPHKGWFETDSETDAACVEWAMKATGVLPYAERGLQTLSGGERQRAWLAMAVAQQPKLLLLDEPTTYLDIAHQLDLMELVKQLNREHGMTVAMVLHDINQAAKYSDRLIVMQDGRIACDGPPAEVLTEELFRRVFRIRATVSCDRGYPVFTAEESLRQHA